MESDFDTYFDHFKNLIAGVKDLRELAAKLGANDVVCVLAALEGTFYMGDLSHIGELAD